MFSLIMYTAFKMPILKLMSYKHITYRN